MFDIYFKDEYGKLYEDLPCEKYEIFRYEDKIGTVSNRFIKRIIPKELTGKYTYYDLITPYGYGGPIVEKLNFPNKKGHLIKNYEKSFQKYANKENIVSEFIRFHPILKNAEDFKQVYDVTFDRKTLGTDLARYDDPFQAEFSKSARKNIRRTLKQGVSYEVDENPSSIEEFLKIYNMTMDRNKADGYYYFGKEYFENIVNNINENTILVRAIYKDITIAAGLYFIYDKTIHIHLSGTLDEYLKFSPAYILRYAVTLWGKERGYKLIHHGGGRTNSKEDGLFRFKKRFAQNTEFDYYIGKKIWNKVMYKNLTTVSKLEENNKSNNFFPLYRS